MSKASKGGPTEREDNLHKALSHPLRVRLLLLLAQEVASPNLLAQQVKESLNLVAYHVRVLEKFNTIELVETKPRRGATEHFYKINPESPIVRLILTERFANATPLPPKAFAKAFAEGRGARASIASTTPLQLDEKGRKEVAAVLRQMEAGLREAEDKTLVRCRTAKVKPTSQTVALLAFPSDDRSGSDDGDKGASPK